MSNRLLLHSIDACTRSADRDPLLRVERTKICKRYISVCLVGLAAMTLWGYIIATGGV